MAVAHQLQRAGGHGEGQRQQLRRLVGRVAEHQPLVASAAAVHAMAMSRLWQVTSELTT